MTTPEGMIKRQIKDYLDSIDAFWSMVAGGAYSKPGDPDMIACVDGMYVGIEAKTPTGRQSNIQKMRQREIERAGGVYILARSVEDVKGTIEKMRECEYGNKKA